MPAPHFRIYPAQGRWAWMTLQGADVLDNGIASTRAEAAAFVIRALVRATTGDPQAGPTSLRALAA